MRRSRPPGGIWCHITGTDLVRDRDGTIYVLEDNLRCTSGVSYVLENRAVMKQTFPKVFEGLAVRPVVDYPGRLLRMLEEVAPRRAGQVRVAVLTPGVYNCGFVGKHFWARGYFVSTVGRDEETIRKYIRHQESEDRRIDQLGML